MAATLPFPGWADSPWWVPPPVWKPYLEFFTLFKQLPLELRQAIWKLTLEERVVEVKFSGAHGYYSPVRVPVALSVCKDSRDTIKWMYPMCYGSIMHEANIVFNFQLDTLYLSKCIANEIITLMYSMKGLEAENLQRLALSTDLVDEEAYECEDIPIIEIIGSATRNMPALEDVDMILQIDDEYHGHGFPSGHGDMKIYEQFPDVLQAKGLAYHPEDDADAILDECQSTLPNEFSYALRHMNAPYKRCLWGWRPTEVKHPKCARNKPVEASSEVEDNTDDDDDDEYEAMAISAVVSRRKAEEEA